VKYYIQSIIGIFKVTDENYKYTKYITCNGKSCKKFDNSENAEFNCYKMFKINSNEYQEEKFCNSISYLNYTMTNNNKKESKYLIENGKSNIFNSQQNGKYIIISITGEAITLTNIYKGKYI